MRFQSEHNINKGELIQYLVLIAFGLIVISFFLGLEWRATGGIAGVPLDDSWIHFRFADNLRNGYGFSFNPGNPTPGSTSPLWVGILSIIDFGYLLPSKIIGIIAFLTSGIVVYKLARQFNLRWFYALLAGIGSLAAGRFAWSAPSGMETTTFALVTLLALWSWARAPKGEVPWYTSLLLGTACLLRPEGYLLLIISCILLILERGEKKGWHNRFRVIAKHIIISSLVLLPYLLFSLLSTGQILPNTFYVKRSAWDCQPSLAYFGWISAVFWLDNMILTSLSLVGTIWILRSKYWRVKRGLLFSSVWVLSIPLVYGIMAPCISGYYTRYTTPLIPFVMILGALGGQELEAWIRFRLRHRNKESKGKIRNSRLMRLILIEGIILALIPTILFWGPFFGQNVADIQNMHLKIGNWLAQQSEKDDVIALNDIGAISYIADRQVIDLMGLVSPEVIKFVENGEPGTWDLGLAKYLQTVQPAFLVIFPNWFPEMINILPIERMYSVQLEDRNVAGIPGLTMVGGGEMVIYQLDWSNLSKP
jgi:hypothetical protein